MYNALKLTAAETVHLRDSTLKQYDKYSPSSVCAKCDPVFVVPSVAFVGSWEEIYAVMVPHHQCQHLGSW